MAATVLRVGDGTASSHAVLFDIGAGAANPVLRYNASTGIEVSLDGTVYVPVTSTTTGASLRVWNATGGTLTAGTLVYISAYNAGQALYQISKAVVTTDPATTFYAKWIVDADVLTAAAGYVTTSKILTGLNTSSGYTAGRPLYLSSTAGGYVGTAYTDGSMCQEVGNCIEVHASTGRVQLQMPGQVIPWSLVDQI